MTTFAVEEKPTPDKNPVAKKKSILQYEITKKKVKPTELMHFSRQLGAFVRAGIPILDALEIIADGSPSKTMKEALQLMSRDVAGGLGLSAAARKHSHVFPEFYVRTLQSAELTGQLDSVLDQLSRYIERDDEARRKVRGAMIYPAIIVVLSMVTVGILSVFVLPRFKTFFAEFNSELPLTTRIVMGTGDFVRDWWFLLAGFFIALAIFWILAIRTTSVKRIRDRALLAMPVIGDLIRFAIIERFCRSLSSLTSAAVTIPEALEVASTGTNNLIFEEALAKARMEMIEGKGLARPIADTKLFPPTIVQMIRVGEETGTLDTQLKTAADFYEVELSHKIKRFTTMIEPAVIIIVGGIVGFVAISLVSAMYGIYNQIGV